MLKGEHHHNPGSRVKHTYRAADMHGINGFNYNRHYRTRITDEHELSQTGLLDALLATEPGSEEALSAVVQIRIDRLRKSNKGE